ncbi:differentially expressed in FDCP 8-like [Megalobrama amblycephala]|uniref:differentially expressed in FDCP 8-like n=1 Tax=Megalobrama amblycephala TaxID=75352 RepID=UPI002013E0A5|nr:differentially expressed in FDCP 8-like [Megalobrama amblycephala]
MMMVMAMKMVMKTGSCILYQFVKDPWKQRADVTSVMEYNERLARFRQGHVNPFDRGEKNSSTEGKNLLKHEVRSEIFSSESKTQSSDRAMDLGLAEDHFSRPVVST